MKQLTMKKEELKEIIQKNMKQHIKDYKIMKKNYFKMAMKEIKKLEKEIENKNFEVSLNINLSRPRSNEKSYQMALDMLNYDINEEVVLSDKEFQNLVQDKWDWSREFDFSKSIYLD